MKTLHLAPRDLHGRRLRKGSRVQIVGVPNLSGIRHARARQRVQSVFLHIKGQVKKVRGFSRYGFVEIFFKIHPAHSFWPVGTALKSSRSSC